MCHAKYAARMARLSARIFGEVANPKLEKDTKVIKLFSKPYYHEISEHVNYYPKHFEINDLMRLARYHGLYR